MGKKKVIIMTAQEGFNYCLKQLGKCNGKIRFLTGMCLACGVTCGYLIAEVRESRKRIRALEKMVKNLEQSKA